MKAEKDFKQHKSGKIFKRQKETKINKMVTQEMKLCSEQTWKTKRW